LSLATASLGRTGRREEAEPRHRPRIPCSRPRRRSASAAGRRRASPT
jgi:hypothetical protein